MFKKPHTRILPISLPDSSNDMLPVDLKFGGYFVFCSPFSLLRHSCFHHFDVRVPVCRSSVGKRKQVSKTCALWIWTTWYVIDNWMTEPPKIGRQEYKTQQIGSLSCTCLTMSFCFLHPIDSSEPTKSISQHRAWSKLWELLGVGPKQNRQKF